MEIIEVPSIIISLISVLLALVSIVLSYCASKKANDIAAEQKRISHGQIELQIHQMIFQTKKDLLEIALRVNDEHEDILKQAFETARELNLNAYDEACSKYLDNKVDRDRFKRNYHVEIRQLVESPVNQEKFNGVTSKYKCILKVYKEWNNLENN